MDSLFHPGIGEWVNYSTQPLPEDGDEQVARVIQVMRGYVNEDYQTPMVTAQALSALQSNPNDPLQAVFDHVKGRVAFQLDDTIAGPVYPLLGSHPPSVVEVLIRPVDMAGETAGHVGDCDDFAMYTAALLLNLGIPCSFVTIAADPTDPSRFSHVYVAAYPGDGRGRVAMDTSHGDGPGWESPRQFRIQEWPVQSIGGKWWMVLGLALAATWGLGKGRH